MIADLGAAQIVVDFIMGEAHNRSTIELLLLRFLLLVGMAPNPISGR